MNLPLRLLLASLVVSAPVAEAMTPAAMAEPFRAEYQVLRDGKELGQATITLEAGDGDHWSFETRILGTRGLAALAGVEIVERSEFRWEGDAPELIRYAYRQDVSFRSRERSLEADAASGRIISRQDQDEAWDLRFEAGVMDRNAVILALARKVSRGSAELRFRVADRDDVEWQRYRIARNETLDLPGGAVDTRRIERIREKPGRETTTWLAPTMGYLPVRIRQREPNGDSLELRLIRVVAEPAADAPTAADRSNSGG